MSHTRVDPSRVKEAAIALLLLLPFFLPAANVYPQLNTPSEFSVDAMLNRWVYCRDVLDSIGGYELEVVGDTGNGTFRNFSQVQIDGKFALKTIQDEKSRLGKTNKTEESSKVIANPDYAALISLRADGKWFLDKMLLRTDPSYATSFRGWFSDGRFVSITPELIEDLRSCQTTSIVQKPIDGPRIFEITFENVSEHLVECKVEVSESHGWLPSSVLFQSKDGTLRKHEFRNWAECESVMIWREVVASITSTGAKYTYTWTADVLSRAPKTDECYLTAYGLPEPPIPSHAKFYVLASVIALLVVVMLVIARNRK